MSRSRRSATCPCLSGTQVYHPCFSKVIKFLPFGSPFAYRICILQNKTSREEAKSTSVFGEEGTLTIWRRFEVWSLTKELPGWSSTCLNLYLVLINEVSVTKTLTHTWDVAKQSFIETKTKTKTSPGPGVLRPSDWVHVKKGNKDQTTTKEYPGWDETRTRSNLKTQAVLEYYNCNTHINIHQTTKHKSAPARAVGEVLLFFISCWPIFFFFSTSFNYET